MRLLSVTGGYFLLLVLMEAGYLYFVDVPKQKEKGKEHEAKWGKRIAIGMTVIGVTLFIAKIVLKA